MQACDARWASHFTAELCQTGAIPPCVTQSRRKRMLMRRLKKHRQPSLEWPPISQAKCDRSSRDVPPTAAIMQPRQPKRTNPKHDVEAQGARNMFRASSAVNARKGPKAREARPWPGFSQHSVRGLFEPGTCPARPREAYSLKRYPTPRTVSMWLEIWGPSLARMRLTWTSTVREPPQ